MAQTPRGADGKPDLTGVWQGGSNRPGKWEDANNGLGVGGTGKDPSAPPSSQQVITAPAPYQPWAAARVLESFNKRGIDDPAALCLPAGIPRLVVVSLFPIEIVQTPRRMVFMHEATIDDPKVLTEPWTIRTTMMAREGTRVQEYVCAENNRDPAQYERLLKEGVSFRR